jgi:PAS domain S-box-containing protein
MAKLGWVVPASLRERAERHLRAAPQPGSARDEAGRLVHELEIHQVELSMQNEELQRAQLELEHSHAELLTLYDQAPVGYLTCTPAGHILRANPCLAELLDTTVTELVGTSFPRFAATDYHDAFHLHAMALRGTTVSSCEIQLVSCAGSRRVVRLDSRAERDENGSMTRMKICVIDLTEQKRAEARTRELSERNRRESDQFLTSKLESVGMLAGGIAHDFNNLLTGILGNAGLARSNPAQADELLEEVEAAARRAAALANQLLTFAKGGQPVKKAIQLAGLIAETAQLCLRESKVRLVLALAPDLWSVDGDEGQLCQVIRSLVMNAKEAMPDGGTLVIGADNVTLDEGEVPSLSLGRHVRIRIEDEGMGIREVDRLRVFDPYFTTKGGRSGLGLATAFSMVHKHGGLVVAASRPSGGTAMLVYLPATSDAAPAGRPASRSAPDPRRHGRVLVMDDEASLRRLILRILSGKGLDVDVVGDGRAAVDAYRKGLAAGQPYDVVILDLTVPGGMGGLEALVQLRAADPMVQAIAVSGYSDSPVMSKPAHYGFAGVLKKPFSPSDLTSLIEDVRTRRTDSQAETDRRADTS